jgi:hypothetical protein
LFVTNVLLFLLQPTHGKLSSGVRYKSITCCSQRDITESISNRPPRIQKKSSEKNKNELATAIAFFFLSDDFFGFLF